MENTNSKPEKGVFVIMPFTETPLRKKKQLDSFFEDNIRKTIQEEADLDYQYRVWRSGKKFDIIEEIIRDLFKADIVIADLSGEVPNPNVMYELGVRLTISDKPVILIREKNPDTKPVFDVDIYQIHEYDISKYKDLESHLIEKLKGFETGTEKYESPVKKSLRGVEIKYFSILDQRDKLQKFCSRVEGAWWQLIIEKHGEERWWQRTIKRIIKVNSVPKISISFIQFEPEEVTNEVYIHGETFDENGGFLGRWESTAVGILESQRKILYLWKARLPRHPGVKFQGFGDFGDFKIDATNDKFSRGGGRFMNTRISDPPISWWKDVVLRRITKREDIDTMTNGDTQKKRELLKKTIDELKREVVFH